MTKIIPMNCLMISFMDNIKKILLLFVGIGGLLLSPWASFAQKNDEVFPPKPNPAVYVHDYSGWLNDQQKSALEYKLRRYWDSTSTQIVVMIRPDLGDYDRATYAVELGNRWGIGGKERDNGVVILIKTEAPDRGVFIATGYGAEGGLTDLMSGRIIRNTMSPFFREKKYYEGIDAGVDDIIKVLAGEFEGKDSSQTPQDGGAGLFMLLIIALIIFIVIRRMRKLREGGDWYTHSGPRHNSGGGGWWMGGGGSGWGGSGGGGGGFGGGSFGGGSFGGGGAGGDW